MVRIMEFKEILPDISGWERIHRHYTRQAKPNAPKMSVIIPTSNEGHLLEVTLQSYINQKNVEKELIVVDAESSDHTTALLEKYKEHIARVYYVTHENISLMINKGFSLATGQYVSFLLPGMEFLNQHCLAHIANLVLEDLNPDVLFSGTYLSWPDYSKIKDAIFKPLDELEAEFVYFPLNKTWLKRGFLPSSPCSIWFKKEYFKKLGGINYKTKILRKCIYDLLCRIAFDENAQISTTFWSTTFSDTLTEKRALNQIAVLSTFPLIAKYFGIFNAIVWLFRTKPVHFISATISRIGSFFRE